jgi:hypothetical protein
MTIAIRAHFDGKVLIPEEPVRLPVNQTLILHITPAEPAPNAAPSALQWLAENAVDDPALPTDLAQEHDHYLYGSPKKEP